ncbi:MAG: UDP-N-acetylglucosamine 1-carboxyvinyltransferase [Clostridia bacterium]|nr:UDP-N-acetylglucosamine 1-carboxyvinyltransferase [Clostridia bacterium]MBQ6000606.1 UDP-N-acetylglucosamine 1-carboxyvinyltransferase [Clostridia bacterium]
MEQYIITGGHELHGSIPISGAKNAALGILPATLLCSGVCRIENLPQISDVRNMLDILASMGVRIRYLNKNAVEIDTTHTQNVPTPYEMVRKLRASYYLIGALLGRFGKAEVALPGGCDFGFRPIDQHIKGFEALGATVQITEGGIVQVEAKDGLVGASIYLDVVSVGATMNIMLAAALIKGQTVIENAAREPHIVDLANFLNTMGADITGAGTDVIKVRGVEQLHGCTYSIIPDQIEAGTYLALAAATGGAVTVTGVIPKHLESITAKLSEMGAEIEEGDDTVTVRRDSSVRMRRINLKTQPYPGFPTDMQPQFGVLMSMAEGTSILTEGIYDNRYRYVNELRRMGAEATVDGRIAVFEGVEKLNAAPVHAPDLRAGAALIMAALCAEGTTVIDEIHYIERGYEDIVRKLKSVGAEIRLVEIPDGAALERAN